MGKSIDVGNDEMNIICAEKEGDSTVFAQERNAFLEIDEQVAIATGTTKERVTSIKDDSFALDTEFELGSVEGALSIYYDALITYIIQNLRSRLAEVTPPEAEFPVAVAGGSARPKGFIEMFEKRLAEAKLSIDVSKINKAKEPIYNVARGCLIAALTKEGEEKTSKVGTTSQPATSAGEGYQS